jgi:hypothetical protein
MDDEMGIAGASILGMGVLRYYMRLGYSLSRIRRTTAARECRKGYFYNAVWVRNIYYSVNITYFPLGYGLDAGPDLIRTIGSKIDRCYKGN